MSEDLTSRMRKFWARFVELSDRLVSLHDCGRVNELNTTVTPMVQELCASIGWEIGPGTKKLRAFTLTFNGQVENIPKVDAIVRSAPHLSQWEFHSGRPVKKWRGTVIFRNLHSQEVNVNIKDWYYTLVGFDQNRFFDVNLFGDFPSMDGRARAQMAGFVVQALLGERFALERIDNVSVTRCSDPTGIQHSTPLRFLRKHVMSIVRDK